MADANQADACQSRLEPGILDELRAKKAAILGCGAVGSSVARMLAQMGVGQMILTDPQVLEWENIGRHELGAAEVGQNKAKALAGQIRRNLPHIEGCDAYSERWMDVAARDENLFDDCDIVVSTTGDWMSEVALDEFLRSRGFEAPVIYGWLERRAMAAHAVALSNRSNCFRCGFDPQGVPLIPATSWFKAEDGEQCAAMTSPFGSIDLAFCNSMIAGLAADILLNRASPLAHRVWLARTAELERQGGYWSAAMIDVVGDPGPGGKMLGLPWPRQDNCMQCAKA